MTIKEVLKTLDVSAFKVFFYSIFSKASLVEYLYDKANNAVNALLEAKADTVVSVRAALAKVNGLLMKYAGYIPPPWEPQASALNAALLELYTATEDGKVVSDEAKAVVEKAMILYSSFKSE